MSQSDEPAYLHPLPDNVILVRCDASFGDAVFDAIKQGATIKEIAVHCGMRESVIRMILLRKVGRRRGERSE